MKFILTVLLLMQVVQLTAQNTNTFSIQGKVLDESGQPLPGTYVLIDSLNIGTTTDLKGNYQLKNVPIGTHQLTAQMVGRKKQTIAISIKNQALKSINFRLKEDTQQMGEVVVRGKTEAQVLRQSAKAVDVIETKEVKLQSADMGDVMARTQGVNVRRTGGLGSDARFSLNGLSGDQIRFFLDGNPLEFTPYVFGIANVPVNRIKQIEIYKGVVPIQFGADALGGAVNLVSPDLDSGTQGSISYQTGSFGTHRTSADMAYTGNSGFFVSGGGFHDFSKNNYKVDVEVADERGRLSEVTVPRFHDDYQAYGANLSIGVKNKAWADELRITGFYSAFDKDIQHNNIMAGIPYGDVSSQRITGGATYAIKNHLMVK